MCGIKKKLKITTFLIVGFLLLVLSLIMFFYYLPRPGGESMGALIYLLFIIIAIVMIIIDRFLVRYIKTGWLSIFEIVFLFIIIFLFLYSNKTAKITVDIKHNYFALIDSDLGIKRENFKNRNLFDKEIVINDTNIIKLDYKSLNGFIIDVDIHSWNLDEITEFEYKNKKIEIHFDGNLKWTELNKDSILTIIKTKIK